MLEEAFKKGPLSAVKYLKNNKGVAKQIDDGIKCEHQNIVNNAEITEA